MKPDLLSALWIAAVLPLLAFNVPKYALQFRVTSDKTPPFDRGAKLYETCAACHGAAGGGSADGLVPRIAGQHFTVINKQLLDFRHGRRWDIRMEKVASSQDLPDAESVANLTRQNGIDFLRLAADIGIVTQTTAYPLGQANRALDALRNGRINGAAVLVP